MTAIYYVAPTLPPKNKETCVRVVTQLDDPVNTEESVVVLINEEDNTLFAVLYQFDEATGQVFSVVFDEYQPGMIRVALFADCPVYDPSDSGAFVYPLSQRPTQVAISRNWEDGTPLPSAWELLQAWLSKPEEAFSALFGSYGVATPPRTRNTSQIKKAMRNTPTGDKRSIYASLSGVVDMSDNSNAVIKRSARNPFGPDRKKQSIRRPSKKSAPKRSASAQRQSSKKRKASRSQSRRRSSQRRRPSRNRK